MKIDVLSLFPSFFESPLNETIVKRAQDKGLLEISCVDMRDYAEDRYRQMDDRPFGGGPGMVLLPKPVTKALRAHKKEGSKTIYLSPRGTLLTAKKAKELSQCEHLILLCGHYEGVDERALKEVDEELSIGDYVLSHGGLAALVVIDTLMRFIPGVLGHEESSKQDSFEDNLLDCPHYTRPQEFEGEKVPDVLLSGHHEHIQKWRAQKALEVTRERRPDLIQR